MLDTNREREREREREVERSRGREVERSRERGRERECVCSRQGSRAPQSHSPFPDPRPLRKENRIPAPHQKVFASGLDIHEDDLAHELLPLGHEDLIKTLVVRDEIIAVRGHIRHEHTLPLAPLREAGGITQREVEGEVEVEREVSLLASVCV